MKELVARWRTESVKLLAQASKAIHPADKANLEVRGLVYAACVLELEEVLEQEKV
jgi:hypothetical protein